MVRKTGYTRERKKKEKRKKNKLLSHRILCRNDFVYCYKIGFSQRVHFCCCVYFREVQQGKMWDATYIILFIDFATIEGVPVFSHVTMSRWGEKMGMRGRQKCFERNRREKYTRNRIFIVYAK